MRKLYTLLLFLFVIVQIQAKITAPDSNTNTFIPTWKTNNSGSSSDTLITIPISGIDKVPINRVLPIYDAVTPNADGVVYVKKGATGDGSSWASATGELADALLEASTNTAIKQIWVAGGTYSPKYAADFSSADNRDVTFLMQIDVKMYGGFAGTETTLANRDLTLTANKTILSGELGTLNNATDNAYHVVVMTGEAGTAELNGFTITRGYANGIQSLTTTNGNAVNRSFGGAMQLVSASPVLANLEFIANTAKSGGALALLTEANASIQDVVFKNNTADFGGGVTIRYGNTSVFDRVTFSGNSASSDGGAINLVNSVAPVFKNVQVTGNKASRYGGAVLIGDNIASTVIFLNTVFSGNASSDGTIYILTGNITIRNSIMYGNSHGITNNGGSSSTVNIVYSLVQGVNANLANNTINGSIDPLFVSPNAFNNAPSTAGNYALKANSPVINKGANNLYNGLDSNTKDLAGKPRVHNYNNSGTIDIGAYEYQEINADGIIYVNANATGSGTGISWTNAATNLGEALVMAQTLNTNTAGTIKQIWVAGGTYYPKYAVDFSSGFEGDKAFLMLKDVKMYGGFAGTETTLASRDLTITANKTILSGDLGILNNATDNAYHVVVMAGAAGTAELNGFTITGGSAGKGGSLTVNGQTLLGPYGGGLALVAASPVLANLEFVQNTASNGAGLALQSGSNASLQDVVFKNNLAYLGGAVYITSGNTSVFERVTFSGNQANSHGGAIYIGSNSTSVFKNIEISGNKALENGGAVYILNNVGKVSFINSVISGNTSNNGAIYTQGASIIVQNSIIYDNSHGVISSGVSDPNTVVYSLVQNIAADATNHILDGSSPVSFVNAPSYTTAPFSGGDYRLSSGSVGIDAGSNSFFSGLTASSKDLAGKPRIYNYNNSGTIDIGAYEYQGLNTDGIIYVNTNATGSGTGSSWTNAATNLGEALRMAKTLNTSTAGTVKQIWVAGGTYYPKYAADFSSTDNRNKAFVMLRDVKMYGGFAGTETTLASRNLTLTANKTILSGDLGILNNVTDNAYHVVVMADGASNAELNGFTITKGYANGTGYLPLNGQFLSGSQGGGMILVESSPVLSNIQFLENTANAGGALELYSRSNPIIQNTIFKNNIATYGGAVHSLSNNASVFERVTFSGNSAMNGGAIFIGSISTTVFKNTEISGNKANDNGGGVYIINNTSKISFINSVISGNSSNNGAIYTQGASIIVQNSIIYGNSDGIISTGSSDPNTIVYSLVQGINADAANNIIDGSIDPLFVSPNTYSNAPSTTGNYALTANSPLVNKGSNSLYNGLDSNTKDLAGNPRVFDYANAGIIDIGAYESQVFPLVTSAGAQTNLSCNGDNNGSATVNVTGGTVSYSYSWNTNPVQTTATASNLKAGTYIVTVKDALNTIKTQSFTITEPTALTVTPTQTDVACNGSATGSATVSVSGGTGSYTYSWNTTPVQTSATATTLSAGNYIVTITDANNCSTTQSFTITEPTALTVTPTQTDVACNGFATGSATVNVSGGTGSYSYSWNTTPVQTSATATTLAAGNYIVTIKDANNCSITQSFTITEPTALIVTPTQTDVACNGSATGSVTVSVSGGTGSYTYSWNTTPVQTSATATALAAGNYIVTIKDANNCSTTQSFTITEPTALTVTPTQTDVACNGSATGSATVSVSGGTGSYSYSWNTTPVQTSATATALAAGNYIVTIKDANNCSITQSFTITEPTALVVVPTQTDVTCNGFATGSATVNVSGGTGSYSYSWNTTPVQTSATATALAAGNYIVTVKDANNCSTTQSFTIREPTALTVTPTQTDVTCNGSSTGSATVSVSGGTGSYSYSWNTTPIQTSATATGLSAGTYIVTIKDANNCSTTQSFNITEPTALTITPTQTDVACNGLATGSATVSVSGGTGSYTYSWNTTPVQTLETATGLSAGTYIVTIKDVNNCSTTQSFTITEPTALSVTPTQTDVACNGSPTGSATVTVSGGTGTYSYSWNTTPVQTSATATALAAGNYIVTIKDANNCSTTQSFNITEPTALTAVKSQNNVSCYNGNNGSATVNAIGGTSPYTYSWVPFGGNSNTATQLTEGSYTVTITDANGCSTNETIVILQPVEPVILKTLAASNIAIDSVMLSGAASSDGNSDNGQCLTETGFVYALHSIPLITDNKINIGSSLGTYSSSLSGLKGNTIYYVRTYAVNAAGFINYGNEISFTTQKYILNITASAGQTKIYGDADPVFNYSVSGFVNGDTNSIISGALSREIGENAGKYNINSGNITAGSDYTITFTGAEFEIIKADQVITWNQSLDFGCNNEDEVNLNASSSSGLVISYTIANPVIGSISGSNLQIINSGSTSVNAYQNGDQNYNPATVVIKPIEVSQSGLVTQKWEDVLFFNNKSTNFVSWQWYKNGSAVSGATRQYYNETQPLNGSYYVIATGKDGKSIKSCPLDLIGTTFSKKMKIYPNPVKPLNEFTLECDFNESQLNGAQITIFDITGKLVQTISNVKSKNQITAPIQAAVYVIMLKLSNGEQKTINILVK